MEANVKVVMHSHGRGELYIDGNRVANVRKVTLVGEAVETNIAVVELIPTTIEASGEFEVTTIESDAREFREGRQPWYSRWRWWK